MKEERKRDWKGEEAGEVRDVGVMRSQGARKGGGRKGMVVKITREGRYEKGLGREMVDGRPAWAGGVRPRVSARAHRTFKSEYLTILKVIKYFTFTPVITWQGQVFM